MKSAKSAKLWVLLLAPPRPGSLLLSAWQQSQQTAINELSQNSMPTDEVAASFANGAAITWEG